MKSRKLSYFLLITVCCFKITNAAPFDELEDCKKYSDYCVEAEISRTELTSSDNDYYRVTEEDDYTELSVLKGFDKAQSTKYIQFDIKEKNKEKPEFYAGSYGPLCYYLQRNPKDPYSLVEHLVKLLFDEYSGCSSEAKEFSLLDDMSGVISMEIKPPCDEFEVIMQIWEEKDAETADLRMTVKVIPDEGSDCRDGDSPVTTVVTAHQVTPNYQSNFDNKVRSREEKDEQVDKCQAAMRAMCYYGTITVEELNSTDNDFVKIIGEGNDKRIRVLRGLDYNSSPRWAKFDTRSEDDPKRNIYHRVNAPVCETVEEYNDSPYEISVQLIKLLFDQYKDCGSNEAKEYAVTPEFSGAFAYEFDGFPGREFEMILEMSESVSSKPLLTLIVKVVINDDEIESDSDEENTLPSTTESTESTNEAEESRIGVTEEDKAECEGKHCVFGTLTITKLESGDSDMFKVTEQGSEKRLSVLQNFDIKETQKQWHVNLQKSGESSVKRYVSDWGSLCMDIFIYRNKIDLKWQLLSWLFNGYDDCVAETREFTVPMTKTGTFLLDSEPLSCDAFDVLMWVGGSSKSFMEDAEITMYAKMEPDNVLSCEGHETTTSNSITSEPTTLPPDEETSTEEPEPSSGESESEPTASEVNSSIGVSEEDQAKCQGKHCVFGTLTITKLESSDSNEIFKVTEQGSEKRLSLPQGFDWEETQKQWDVQFRKPGDSFRTRYVSEWGNLCMNFLWFADKIDLKWQLLFWLFNGYDGCDSEPKEFTVPMTKTGTFMLDSEPPSCDAFEVLMWIGDSSSSYEETAEITMYVRMEPNNILSCEGHETTTSNPITSEPTTLPPNEETSTEEPEPIPSELEPELRPNDPESEPSPSDPEAEPSPSDPEAEPSPSDPEAEPSPSDPEAEPSPSDPEAEPSPSDPEAEPSPSDPEAGPSPNDPETEPSPGESESEPTANEVESRIGVSEEDEAKCQGKHCVFGTLTVTKLESSDSNEIFKITERGSEKRLSLPQGFDWEETQKQWDVQFRKPGDSFRTRYVSEWGNLCMNFLWFADKIDLKWQLLFWLFNGYDGCDSEPKEFTVPMTKTGTFMLDSEPPSCDAFEVLMWIGDSSSSYEETAEITMYVRMEPNNILSCEGHETTTSNPITSEPTTLPPNEETSTEEPEPIPSELEPELRPNDPESEPSPSDPEAEPSPSDPEAEPSPSDPEAEPSPSDPEAEPSPSDPEAEPSPSDPEAEPSPSDPEAESSPSDPEAETSPSDPKAEPSPSDPEAEPSPSDPEAEPSPSDPEAEPSPSDPEAEPSPSEPEAEPSPSEPEAEPSPSDPEAEPSPSDPEAEPSPSDPQAEPSPSDPEAEPSPSDPEAEPSPSEPEAEPSPSEPEAEPSPSDPEAEPSPSDPEAEPSPSDPEAEPSPSDPEAEPSPSDPETESSPSDPQAEPGPSDPEAEPSPSDPEAEPSPSDPEAEPSPSEPEAEPSPSDPEAELSPSDPGAEPSPSDPEAESSPSDPEPDPNSPEESDSESGSTSITKYIVEQEKCNCHYMTWLSNYEASYIPNITDYHVWLTSNGCLYHSEFLAKLAEEKTPYGEIVRCKARSGSEQDCDYSTWLKNDTSSDIPHVSEYWDWLASTGCVYEQNYTTALFEEDTGKSVEYIFVNKTKSKDKKDSEPPHCGYFDWLRQYSLTEMPSMDEYYVWLAESNCAYDEKYVAMLAEKKAAKKTEDESDNGSMSKGNSEPTEEPMKCDYFTWLRSLGSRVPDHDEYMIWKENSCNGATETSGSTQTSSDSADDGNILTNTAGKAKEIVSNVVGNVTETAQNAGGTVVETVSNIVGNVAETAQNTAGTVVGTVFSVVGNATEMAKNTAGSVVGTVSNVVGNATETAQNAAGTVAGTVANVVGKVTGADSDDSESETDSEPETETSDSGDDGNVITRAFGTVTDAASSVVDTVTGTVSSVFGKVTGIFTGNSESDDDS